MMKQLDTYTYVSALRELVASGQTVSVRIAGNSMAPFLVDTRDSICFRAPDRPFRRGDMVFYQRETGQYVMHRIARVGLLSRRRCAAADRRSDFTGANIRGCCASAAQGHMD